MLAYLSHFLTFTIHKVYKKPSELSPERMYYLLWKKRRLTEKGQKEGETLKFLL
jgi:hypothetical protein